MGFDFISLALYIALLLLIWDCIEVGRNDAANLVNAVFGARVLRRRAAVLIAGAAVVLGATFSSSVVDTARKGIFDPVYLTTMAGVTPAEAVRMAIIIYISVYIVDTVLLYTYSAFGMPVSTTASLIFELLGAAMALGGLGIVSGQKAAEVTIAIVLSIIFAGIAGFLVQKVFRAAIRDKSEDPQTIYLQGPWIAGAMLTWLCWFLILKGLKNLDTVKYIKIHTFDEYGTVFVLLALWFVFYGLIHILLNLFRQHGARMLFRLTAILGMLSMAFAFGQNDLANCASPGLSALMVWQHREAGLEVGTGIDIARYWLFGCGVLMLLGMLSRNAQRVTRAAANTGSQFDHVALWAPGWCKALARLILRKLPSRPSGPQAPAPSTTETGKKLHYDTLRASVIMSVSASVIAFASSRGLPVSTTYVAFAAVVATGMADRVFVRGDSELKIGRTIWVVSSWCISAVLAMVCSGLVARMIYTWGLWGLAVGILLNLVVRWWAKGHADAQDKRIHEEARQRLLAAQHGADSSPTLLAELERQMAEDER